MTDIAHETRDEALEEAKADYLADMKAIRNIYFTGKTGSRNAYTEACSMIWAKFWEDVG